MGVRAGQDYAESKPKRLLCPSCSKRGVTQWRPTDVGLMRYCQYCQATWGEAAWRFARNARPTRRSMANPAPAARRRGVVEEVRPAGPCHAVVILAGGESTYRRKPCSDCRWRVAAVGEFPAEAFRHSASTAYAMSTRLFSCHQSGREKSAVCAGFLLRGGHHNLAVRMGVAKGRFRDDMTEGGAELHENYRAMAITNGVDPDDPVLAPCRD